MWVNVPSNREFPNRVLRACINQYDLVGWNIATSVEEIINQPDFNETLVREWLHRKYIGVEKWTLIVADYDMAARCVDIIAMSPDFPEVTPGLIAPRIEDNDDTANKFIKELRNKKMSGWRKANGFEDRCKCRACIKEHDLRDSMFPDVPGSLSLTTFIVCPKCGNKRCPKVENHRYRCTWSNEPGQVGVPEDD